MAKWSNRSRVVRSELAPPLARVADLAQEMAAAKGLDFILIDGERAKSEQILNKKKGVSKTLISAHLAVSCSECAPGVKKSHALDFAPLIDDADADLDMDDITWVAKYFDPIADCFAQAAKKLGIKIVRGIDWGKQNNPNASDPQNIGWDAGHIELSNTVYKWKPKVEALWAKS